MFSPESRRTCHFATVDPLPYLQTGGPGSARDVQPLVSETLLSPYQWGMGPLPPPHSNGSGALLIPKLRQPALSRDAAPPREPEGASSLQHQKAPRQQPAVQTARVWLGSLQRHCQLLPFTDGPLMVLVLLHDHVVMSPDVLVPIAEVRNMLRCQEYAIMLPLSGIRQSGLRHQA